MSVTVAVSAVSAVAAPLAPADDGYESFLEFLKTPSVRNISTSAKSVLAADGPKDAIVTKRSKSLAADDQTVVTVASSRSSLQSSRSQSSSFYGVFSGWGPEPGQAGEDSDSDRPVLDKQLSYNQKIAAAKKLNCENGDRSLSKSSSFYGVFNGWGPEPGEKPEKEDKPVLNRTKSDKTLYYGIFKGSGPASVNMDTEEKEEKRLTYNQKIASARKLKLEEEGKKPGTYYGMFEGFGPGPNPQPVEEKPKMKKEKSGLYYGTFQGFGPGPNPQATEESEKSEKPLTYNQRIAEVKRMNSARQPSKSASFYGLFDGWGPEPGQEPEEGQ